MPGCLPPRRPGQRPASSAPRSAVVSDLPTVGWSRGMGLVGFSVWCTCCRHASRFTFAELELPDDLAVVEIVRARRFVCSRCGERRPAVMPDWRDYRARGTGVL